MINTNTDLQIFITESNTSLYVYERYKKSKILYDVYEYYIMKDYEPFLIKAMEGLESKREIEKYFGKYTTV